MWLLPDGLLLQHELVGGDSHGEHGQGHHQTEGQNLLSCILNIARKYWEGEDGVDGLESSRVDDSGDNSVSADREVEYAKEISDADETKEDGREDKEKVFLYEQGIYDKDKSHQGYKNRLDDLFHEVV